MNLSGKLGSSPSISAPSAPPRPARPDPMAKVDRNTTFTSMPTPPARPPPQPPGPRRAAGAGRARPDGEGGQEHQVHVDAQAGGHALVVDGGAQATAPARPGQQVLQAHGE